jgi:hypothetical protein
MGQPESFDDLERRMAEGVEPPGHVFLRRLTDGRRSHHLHCTWKDTRT